MTALAELRSGQPGGEFVRELQRTVRAVAVARNFPPPEGHATWDADAVRVVASEFLTDAQTPRRFTDLALYCASDEALRARLQGTVRNFLADLGRRTPIGKLVVRINEVLGTEPGFTRHGGRWARGPAPVEPGHDDPDALARAISAHPVVVPSWGHETRRSAPVADRPTVVSLCTALIDAAGGSLTPRALARAIGYRLGLGQAPLSLDLASLDNPPADRPEPADSTGSAATRSMRAVEVLAQLADPERVAVAYPELPIRQLGPRLGVSPSQAHIVRGRASEIIRTELLDDDDAENIAVAVMGLAKAWADGMDSQTRSDVVIAR